MRRWFVCVCTPEPDRRLPRNRAEAIIRAWQAGHG
jgi:hypothetical protein